MKALIDYLREKLELNGDKYIIDKLSLKEGLYIKINKDFQIMEHVLITNKKEVESSELNYFFQSRCFYSKIVFDSANKCIDTTEKKFHSVHHLSLIFKTDNLPNNIKNLASGTITKMNDLGINVDETNKDEIFKISLESHFEQMSFLFGNRIDYSKYSEGYRLLSYKIIDLINGFERKVGNGVQIAIFMDEDLDIYKECYESYLKEKLFLSNIYNKEFDGVIYGVSAFSNGLNAKKPFLRMLETSLDAPYVVSFEEAMIIQKLYYIFDEVAKELGLDYKTEHDANSKQLVIKNIEQIDKRAKIKPLLEIKALQVRDYEDIDSCPTQKLYDKKDIKGQLNYFSNNIFYDFLYKDTREFTKSARTVYSNDKVVIPLIENKDAIKGYLDRNYNVSIEKAIEKFTIRVMEYEIEKYEPLDKKTEYFNFKKLQAKWDLRVSIMTYFSERGVYKNMQGTLKKIREDLSNQFRAGEGIIEVKNDETYYFLAGQICQYLVSQSQTANKTGRLISPFLKAKNIDKLMKLMVETYDKYSYAIPLHSNVRINRAMQGVLIGYKPVKDLKSLDMQMFLHGGLIGPNIFYEKLNKEDNNNEDMEEIVNE